MTSKAKKETDVAKLRREVKDLVVKVERLTEKYDELSTNVVDSHYREITYIAEVHKIRTDIRDIWNLIDPD